MLSKLVSGNQSPHSFPTVVASDGTAKPSSTTINFGRPIVSSKWLEQCVVLGRLAEVTPFLL